MKKDSKAFLEKYLNSYSPVSFETAGQKVWLEYLKPNIDEHFTDNYGTVVGIINPGAKYKVAIEAHADEISWYVNYITNEGYIYLIRNGGSDPLIAPSKRVIVHTEKGPVRGVFGWPAIHVRNTAKDEAPKQDNIFVDLGCANKEEVEKLGVHVGCVVTFEDEMMWLNGHNIVGRALDNRIGGFMIAEVAKRLKANKVKLPFSLYIVNSVQEEIGLKGAEMISRRIKPDLAIVTDVTHDTQSPMYDKKVQGDVSCGKGPVLCYGPAVQMNVLKMIMEVASKNKIDFQRQAVSRSTGTDTDSFAYSGEGVPSALISLPLKYMHTTVETVHEKDVESVIELIYQTLISIDPKKDFKYM